MSPMSTSRKHAIRASALVATAALVASGTQVATAATGGDHAQTKTARAKAASAQQLSTSQRAALLKTAAKKSDSTAKALGLGKKEKLHPVDVIKDHDGTVHTRYDRTYDGMRVLGGDLVVHQKDDGKRSVTSATQATIAPRTTKAALSTDEVGDHALQVAKKAKTAKAHIGTAPKKVVWAAHHTPVLAYETVVKGTQADQTPSELHVITDASNGKTLFSYQGVENGTGTSQYSGKVKLGTTKSGDDYQLKDGDRGGHATFNLDGSQSGEGTLFTDDDDVWGGGQQTAAVDAHYGAAVTWDYYKDVHGRNGIRDDGKGSSSRVHYGTNYSNAFWTDSCFCMTYGDGEGNKHPLTSMDVAAHEMSHGVTAATANLQYSGESGGLNEATSDMFAAGVEFHVDNPEDTPDYLVGEKIDINGDGTPLRYMDKPSRDGQSLDFWDEDTGNTDVHYSSGVGNHFFYLLSEGSGKKKVNGVQYDSPTKNGKKVTGIGIGKAEKVWYKALTTYMTSSTDYHDARDATLKAANDLYGEDSTEAQAVDAAWAGVNVTG